MDTSLTLERIPALDPVPFGDVREALLEAGFDPEAYRATHEDVRAHGLDPVGHFLEWGHVERRRFPITLGLAGLQRLRHLPFASRAFPQALSAALASAWAFGLPREADRLIASWATVARLHALGAVPFFLAGDASVELYHHVRLRGGRFLLPILLTDELDTTTALEDVANPGAAASKLVATIAALADDRRTATTPTLWSFGSEHLGRPFSDDTDDAASNSIGRLIESVRSFLFEAIGPVDRFKHVLACLLPPLPRPTVDHRALLAHTESVRALNAGLVREASLLEMRVVDDHDTFLGRDGVVAAALLAHEPGGVCRIDRDRAAEIISGSLWTTLAPEYRPSAVLSERVREVLRALRGDP